MVQHLKEFRGLNIIHVEAGIYYITGDAFPMQLLVTRELDPKENLWLQSLRNNMSKPEEIEVLLNEYETKNHRNYIKLQWKLLPGQTGMQ